MAFGLPASCVETRRFSSQQDALKSAIEAAFESLGWRYSTVSLFAYRASLSPNLLSWGERIVVEILPGGEIQVTSKCAYPLQIIDWGKNRQNVRQFFARLDLSLETLTDEKKIRAFDEKGFSPVERIFDEADRNTKKRTD